MPSRERRKLSVGCHEASPTLLHRVRNMWQFANFCQWLYIFGRAVKIPDSVDVEVGRNILYSLIRSPSPSHTVIAESNAVS